MAAHRRRAFTDAPGGSWKAIRPCSGHPSYLSAAGPGQASQYSTMSVPRCGFNRVRDIGTENSNGSFAILFMATSCRFFVEKLGFTVCFQYGKPVFYALVQRDTACLNLRYVHAPVLNREVDADLLSASIPVGNVKALYSEYLSVGAPMAQRLKKRPWGAEDFIVRDPDGNLVHFAQSIELNDV